LRFRWHATRHIKGLKMRNASLLCLVVAIGAFAGHAEAIYKCTTAKGVVYQDRPCREGAESDVLIVIPTGEIAPTSLATPDGGVRGNGARGELGIGAPRTDRATSDADTSAAKSIDKKSANEATAKMGDDARNKGAPSSSEGRVPMTAEQARKAEASAKYYTTDSTAFGISAPEHMTCESPSGEKRRFILADGKLTSI
jgi:hypothetical protein